MLAENALAKSLERKRDYAPAHFLLAAVYDKQGRLDDAVRKMESVRLYHPFDVGVAFELGTLYLKKQAWEEAAAEFRRALGFLPSYANARWYLAYAYEQMGQREQALQTLALLLEAYPENPTIKKKIQELKADLPTDHLPDPIEP
jgi:tetratricopeptide (TPR) repeat protein